MALDEADAAEAGEHAQLAAEDDVGVGPRGVHDDHVVEDRRATRAASPSPA
ncbi:MAG: hypothetical protein U0S36_07580 [Candidatus Nanopelagicales bacterium]